MTVGRRDWLGFLTGEEQLCCLRFGSYKLMLTSFCVAPDTNKSACQLLPLGTPLHPTLSFLFGLSQVKCQGKLWNMEDCLGKANSHYQPGKRAGNCQNSQWYWQQGKQKHSGIRYPPTAPHKLALLLGYAIYLQVLGAVTLHLLSDQSRDWVMHLAPNQQLNQKHCRTSGHDEMTMMMMMMVMMLMLMMIATTTTLTMLILVIMSRMTMMMSGIIVMVMMMRQTGRVGARQGE